MNVLSIDLETTGKNAGFCQILEIGVVLDHVSLQESTVETLPSFHRVVRHKKIRGEATGLSMNQRVLGYLAEESTCPHLICDSEDLSEELFAWFEETVRPMWRTPWTLVGKNFGSFDLDFLRRLGKREREYMDDRFCHRIMDVGNLWMRPGDPAPPGLSECLRRAGLDSTVTHHALEDAGQVVQLVRAWELA